MAIEKQYGIDAMDILSREILYSIAFSELLNKKVRLNDLVAMRVYGTRRTLAVRVNALIFAGWLEKVSDSHDKRKSLFQLTSKGQVFFARVFELFDRF